MPLSHALFYNGPFETNFRTQRPGATEYTKRDGTTAAYRGPKNVSGLRFGQMEKALTRAVVIARVQGPESDVCLVNPIPGRETGPNGAWLTLTDAAQYLDHAIRANPRQRRKLESLRGLVSRDPHRSKAAPASSTDPAVDDDTLRLIDEAPDASTLSDTDRTALIQARRGQGRFRESLLAIWRGSCAVTGCREPAVLRASHLKPWKDSTNAERLNRYNGLLLTPNLDSALDRGLISFTDEGTILLSPTLHNRDRQALGLNPGMKLRWLDAHHQPFLRFHRANRFQDRDSTGSRRLTSK